MTRWGGGESVAGVASDIGDSGGDGPPRRTSLLPRLCPSENKTETLGQIDCLCRLFFFFQKWGDLAVAAEGGAIARSLVISSIVEARTE